MHMISKKDLNDAEMDTLTKSCSPTKVITANAYHTSLHSDTICPVRIQMCSIHQAQQWDLPESKMEALNTADRRVSCTNKQGSHITRNNTSHHSATSDV